MPDFGAGSSKDLCHVCDLHADLVHILKSIFPHQNLPILWEERQDRPRPSRNDSGRAAGAPDRDRRQLSCLLVFLDAMPLLSLFCSRARDVQRMVARATLAQGN